MDSEKEIISKGRDEKSKSEKIVSMMLSIFMGYMTVLPTLVNAFTISFFVLLISSVVYYLFVSHRIIELSEYLVRFFLMNDTKAAARRYIDRVTVISWRMASSILFLGTGLLLILTFIELRAAQSLSGNPLFFEHYAAAEKMPEYIVLPIAISLVVYFIAQVFLSMRYEKTAKLRVIIAHVFSTALTAATVRVVTYIGTLVAYNIELSIIQG